MKIQFLAWDRHNNVAVLICYAVCLVEKQQLPNL
jgi:hypothetical protein